MVELKYNFINPNTEEELSKFLQEIITNSIVNKVKEDNENSSIIIKN